MSILLLSTVIDHRLLNTDGLFCFTTGCVKSKNCGVQIGASGKSWQDDEFFQGHIDDVSNFI